MTGRGRNPKIDARVSEDLLDWLDDTVEATDTSRSALVRRSLHYLREAHVDDVKREAELQAEHDEIVKRNRELRQLLPSKWRSHVRGLFAQDLADDTSPDDLRTLAQAYREQAEKKEEIAAANPMAPEADLARIVDEELAHALEAADLSNWYDGVDNPHERHLSGVEDGKQERDDVVALVEGAVEAHQHVAAIFNDPSEAPPLDESDLPTFADSLLPDDIEPADVADVATRLVRAGVTADEVADVIPTTDPRLAPGEISADASGDVDVEPARMRRGGDVVDVVDEDEQDSTDADDGPQVVPASETTQKQLAQHLASADGGRTPGAVPGTRSVEEDTDMTHDTDNPDSDGHSAEKDPSDRMEELISGNPIHRNGDADE